MGNTTKTNYRKVKGQKPTSDYPKSSTPRKSLEQKLHQIYYGDVNLDTTCKGQITCCKTAMPQLNRSEYEVLVNKIWSSSSKSQKIEMVCKSVEYFFKTKFEQFGLEIFKKPCMLLSDDGKCKYYKNRPLNCRMYGLWPSDVYNRRVDRFEKAYSQFGVKREELPLNAQCPNAKRVDESVPLTETLIECLYKALDALDKKTGNYSHKQIEERYNVRAFHDWVLLSIFGEDWLIELSRFVLGANKEIVESQIEAFKKVIREKFAKEMPNLGI
jgi:Fe-S-cluster containining protein